MTIGIGTDSPAYLPPTLTRAHHIEVVPLIVVMDGEQRLEGVDITSEELAKALRSRVAVSTSRPAPAVFAERYAKLAAAGVTEIVSIHLSAKMSGTVDAAQLAANDAAVPVTVIDSETIGMALGFAVLTGARAAARGHDVAGVVARIRESIAGSTCWFYVDTLEHLRRGGRIGAASALLGSALAIKPILGVRDGRIEPIEKVRTRSKALARLAALAAQAARELGSAEIAVHHVDALERAEEVVAVLREEFGDNDIHLVELGGVVAAHTGPGTIAVAVSPAVLSSGENALEATPEDMVSDGSFGSAGDGSDIEEDSSSTPRQEASEPRDDTARHTEVVTDDARSHAPEGSP